MSSETLDDKEIIQPATQDRERLSPFEMASGMGGAVLRDVNGAHEREPQSSSTVSYKFNFSLHSKENAAEVAESMRDCDIIAIEGTGDTDERRRQREGLYTHLISDAMPLDTLKQAVAILNRGNEGFTGQLLESLAGSNKRIVLIDMSASDPNAHILDEMHEADEAFHKAIAANAPNDTLKQLLIRYVKTTANTSAKREELVINQLVALEDEIDKEYPKKIGVVMGAVHTPVHHAVSERAATERIFTDASDEPLLVKAKYGHVYQAMRQLRFKPSSELDPRLVDRMLIDAMYYTYNFYSTEDLTETHDNDHRGRRIQKEITDNMSDEDVEAFLDQLDQLKAGMGRSVFRKKRPVTKERIYRFLQEHQSHYATVA